MFLSSFRRICIVGNLRRIHSAVSHNTLKIKVQLSDVPDVCNSDGWNDAVQECSAFLSASVNAKNEKKSNPPIQSVVKRLRESSGNNTYLIEAFQELLSRTPTSSLRWPGLVALTLAKSVGNPFQSDDFVSKAVEDASWSSLITLAEVTNLFYCKLLFQKECRRLDCTARITTDKETEKLVDAFFTSAILQKTFVLKNDKALFLIARLLESLDRTKQFGGSNLIPNLRAWEYETFYPQGLNLSVGCQSALELAGFDETSQQLAFQFGENLALAIKTNSDIQQFWNYTRSHSSYISLSSLVVSLHLEKNPETLAYLNSCGQQLDNLDYSKLNCMLLKNEAMTEAKQQLSFYLQNATDILMNFENSRNREIFQSLLKLIKTLENIDE